jgi:hypothetical protein
MAGFVQRASYDGWIGLLLGTDDNNVGCRDCLKFGFGIKVMWVSQASKSE